MCFAAYAGMTGMAKFDLPAFAQQKDDGGKGFKKENADQQTVANGEEEERIRALQKAKEEAGIPVVVEAEVFLLKDSKGNIRGVWTADDEATSFAMMHKEKQPIIAMAVDSKNASMSLTDVYSGKISMGLTDSIRSFTIMDDTKKNNIYLGLTASGEAAFDMVSTGNSAVSIDGSTSSLDMSGDSAILALTETVGSAVALKAQPSMMGLTFLDYQNQRTLDMETVDGQTQLFMGSPALKEEKVFDTKKEEILSFGATAVKPEAAEQKTSPENPFAENKEQPKKEEGKAVDMKSYSPFAK